MITPNPLKPRVVMKKYKPTSPRGMLDFDVQSSSSTSNDSSAAGMQEPPSALRLMSARWGKISVMDCMHSGVRSKSLKIDMSMSDLLP